MKTYQYQTVMSKLMLDYDLNIRGAAGWRLSQLIRIDRTIKGALGSEQGLTREPSGTYVYVFEKEIDQAEAATDQAMTWAEALKAIRPNLDPGQQALIDQLIAGQSPTSKT